MANNQIISFEKEIVGYSEIKDYPKGIPVIKLKLGIALPTRGDNSSVTSGMPIITNAEVVCALGKSGPKLLQACAGNIDLGKVEIVDYQVNQNSQEQISMIELTDAKIKNCVIETTPDAPGDVTQVRISLYFKAIMIKHKDRNVAAGTTPGWIVSQTINVNA